MPTYFVESTLESVAFNTELVRRVGSYTSF